ncbi:hypothetical protein AVEN_194887-1 [Araneus ventricosus]|uniref:Uncharacterized protein n=1 Tax=Araneus ventricosus TaxID=182803 RepID=A0A4Y2B384_ARAVE|nr:hypothetical protein AVEN_194887-1 [Araneus ventricosus]
MLSARQHLAITFPATRLGFRRYWESYLSVTLTPASWSRESILFSTGHGPFSSYLYRFRLHHPDICACRCYGFFPDGAFVHLVATASSAI